MLDIKNIKYYSIFTISTFVFGMIYELFSHDVYSNYMIFAFLIPLILGIFNIIFDKYIHEYLFKSGVITLTIGSIIKGVLDIYGTSNDLVYIYLFGIILLVISLFKKIENT